MGLKRIMLDSLCWMWLFMIGHSLGRLETCFGPSTQDYCRSIIDHSPWVYGMQMSRHVGFI